MSQTLRPINFYDINSKVYGIESASIGYFNKTGKTIQQIAKQYKTSLYETNDGYLLEIYDGEAAPAFIEFKKLS